MQKIEISSNNFEYEMTYLVVFPFDIVDNRQSKIRFFHVSMQRSSESVSIIVEWKANVKHIRGSLIFIRDR